jgi:K(+)-stimulated pyrophosphate-energized sodium pump
MSYELLAPVASVFALLFAAFSTWRILRMETGTVRMRSIAQAIRDGAMTYLKKQYTTIAILAAISALALGLILGAFTAVAFVAGAICSALAGYVGMAVAVRANVRTTQAARSGLGQALLVAFQGGSVMGMMVVGLALLGIYLLYVASGDPFAVVGFGTGASLVGLLARVGGGIYTKGADIGADLVGKIEVGIPEDDPRNPGVIADLVGDNVGDVAGMGADLFESNVGSILAAMLIGVIGAREYGQAGVAFPLALQGAGILSTILGVLLVRALKGIKPQSAINGGMFASALLITVAAFFLAQGMFGDASVFYAALLGIVAALLLGLITQYYTSLDKPPVRAIAESSPMGSANTIISGLAMGMSGAALPIAVICGSIFLAFRIAGPYGMAIATLGMQSITGIIVAMDAFGPIVDNASGIAEMAGLGSAVRKTTDALDSVGNTTKAMCKGFAIGDAGSETIALFLVYMLHAHIETVHLTEPPVAIGLFIGGVLPFAFSGLCLRAVGKTALQMVDEIRRQFREIPGLTEGEASPDYAKCVGISTTAALRSLLAPGVLAVVPPLVLGFTIGPEAVGGLLIGCTVSAFPMAIFMAYAGTAWDNAKKFIEEGHLGGKGSPAHRAAVVGDTVGDPFKDAAGPSLDVLMTILTTVSILFAPLFLRRPW